MVVTTGFPAAEVLIIACVVVVVGHNQEVFFFLVGSKNTVVGLLGRSHMTFQRRQSVLKLFLFDHYTWSYLAGSITDVGKRKVLLETLVCLEVLWKLVLVGADGVVEAYVGANICHSADGWLLVERILLIFPRVNHDFRLLGSLLPLRPVRRVCVKC